MMAWYYWLGGIAAFFAILVGIAWVGKHLWKAITVAVHLADIAPVLLSLQVTLATIHTEASANSAVMLAHIEADKQAFARVEAEIHEVNTAVSTKGAGQQTISQQVEQLASRLPAQEAAAKVVLDAASAAVIAPQASVDAQVTVLASDALASAHRTV
jgi:hypothetical protein